MSREPPSQSVGGPPPSGGTPISSGWLLATAGSTSGLNSVTPAVLGGQRGGEHGRPYSPVLPPPPPPPQQVAELQSRLAKQEHIISELEAKVSQLQDQVSQKEGQLQRQKWLQEEIGSRNEMIQQAELQARVALESAQSRVGPACRARAPGLGSSGSEQGLGLFPPRIPAPRCRVALQKWWWRQQRCEGPCTLRPEAGAASPASWMESLPWLVLGVGTRAWPARKGGSAVRGYASHATISLQATGCLPWVRHRSKQLVEVF